MSESGSSPSLGTGLSTTGVPGAGSSAEGVPGADLWGSDSMGTGISVGSTAEIDAEGAAPELDDADA